MSREPISRRKALQAIGTTAAVTSLAGCTGVFGGGGGGGNSSGGGKSGGGKKSKIEKQKEEVRSVVGKFDGKPGKAMKAGYKNVIGPMIPGMGWHMINPKHVKESAKKGKFDPKKPSMLMFNSENKLGCVEYGAPVPKMPGNPGLFSEFDKAIWSEHKTATHVFSDGNDKVTSIKKKKPSTILTNDNWAEFRPPRKDLKPGDKVNAAWGHWYRAQKDNKKKEKKIDFVVTHPTLKSLHLWLIDNPKGPFSPVNPDFTKKV